MIGVTLLPYILKSYSAPVHAISRVYQFCMLTQISIGNTERQKKNYCMARADLSHIS
jgi:hypothetical protein